MKYVANEQKLSLPQETSVQATVGLGPRSDGGFGMKSLSKYRYPVWITVRLIRYYKN
ncbi:hypothetical protein [Aristophania vespae]|uniref:hypothetical protein n=1 Tax=Aristophania vespae TaxID=2697033 RepID=UPI001F3E63CC|nr:hypothetical protein [Aristophania vespae]